MNKFLLLLLIPIRLFYNGWFGEVLYDPTSAQYSAIGRPLGAHYGMEVSIEHVLVHNRVITYELKLVDKYRMKYVDSEFVLLLCKRQGMNSYKLVDTIGAMIEGSAVRVSYQYSSSKSLIIARRDFGIRIPFASFERDSF